MSKKTEQAVIRAQLKRRSVIRINTDQAVRVMLEFVPGEMAYIHFDAQDLDDFDRVSGFIDDKDIPKLGRFVESILAHAKSKKERK